MWQQNPGLPIAGDAYQDGMSLYQLRKEFTDIGQEIRSAFIVMGVLPAPPSHKL